MRATTERGHNAGNTARRWGRRLGWLMLIWALSVAALGVVAWVLRIFMNAAGMTA
ncbi:DUF2474 family protein [Pusillimonas sp. TS35]|uniref:DUF2474 domain-containing protein n=1 Tax=Paracandidimonas lactea TaxID=2895524 RepID=UPI001371F728|nr:DUF2474 domain-containing protein [Paracandidimonas lactea]MYN12158.1 DUF2474 family protein [Pusillimonas sp. TS35]